MFVSCFISKGQSFCIRLVALFVGFLAFGCFPKHLVEEREICETEIRDAVKNVVLIAKDLRGNSDNVGGDETMVYIPSSYFNPDPEFVADQRPVWMRKPEIAHLFLVAVIASDHGFERKTLSAFAKGFDEAQATKIIEKSRSVDLKAYTEICRMYSYGQPISHEDYKNKFAKIYGTGLPPRSKKPPRYQMLGSE